MPLSDLLLPVALPALNAAILRRAQRDIPILERPPYSNRSPEIDAMCRRWGVPLGSYWCALWAATVWADAGAETPPVDRAKGWHPAKCQTWYEWALETGRFGSRPALGCAVLYGERGEPPAHHLGAAVASVAPLLLDFEGNTSVESFGRNGEMTAVKLVNVERLIGYVHPIPLQGGGPSSLARGDRHRHHAPCRWGASLQPACRRRCTARREPRTERAAC